MILLLMYAVLIAFVASAISEGDIFIHSCSAQLISFEVDSISEHEHMNMSPSLIALATLLFVATDNATYETGLTLPYTQTQQRVFACD